MIKLVGESRYGRKLLVLGLSDENIRRLVVAGDPILVRGHELRMVGLPDMDIAIVYGETEDAVVENFQSLGVQVHTEGNGNA